MNKHPTICFRTSEELHKALREVARDDHRSLSSTIELILTEHVRQKHLFAGRDPVEKRRYPRKATSIPAYVKSPSATTYGAVVLDVSLDGLCLSMTRDCLSQIYEVGEESLFEVSFVPPSARTSVHLVCKTERVVPSNDTVTVGTRFVDGEFTHYQRLQQYLL